MIRFLLKLALAAAAAWAVWAFVPLRGRTLEARWTASAGLSEFLERGWAEATGASPKPAARPQARQKPAPRERPTEGHTEADRRALERILERRLDAPAK